jgi:hypothetical protein
MGEYTPKTLRAQAERFKHHDDWGDTQLRHDYDREAAFTLAHADAWEADLKFLGEDNNTLHNTLLEKDARIAALEKRLEEWDAAARYLLAHYPEDIFPATSDSPDAKAATFARRVLTWLLDPAERTRLADLDDAAARAEEKDDGGQS